VADQLSAEAFSRWFLAGFFVVVAVFYTTKTLMMKKRLGRSPVSLGTRGSRDFVIYGTFRVFRVAILLVCVGRAFWPGLDRYLLPFEPLWLPAVLLAGDALLALSFAAILYLNAHMASDWRSGIDRTSVTPLITSGAFAWSRNPMFLLVQLGQFGLFLALPSLFTLICLVVGMVAIHAQVRLEEAHLAEQHGDRYRAYCERTPRWLWR
jgi:protein-S-isoprenylcysteine O-methyltransferase Ste14